MESGVRIKPGQTVAHYDIVRQLGAGGMGDVYLARDNKLGRDVALKLLSADFIGKPERHARFHREAQLLASFSHPNVASIYSLEEDGEHHFLVLELVEGEDLSARLEQDRPSPREALEIARQIALALQAAHEKGIIHRDLKPQNVKFAGDGRAKVLDFGLAKIFDDHEGADPTAQTVLSPSMTPDITRSGVIMGTAAYMSPEQARGKPVDRRTDIWAFGCLLFEMLAGELAFPGESVSDCLASILRSEPDWTRLPANLHPDIVKLLRRCLQKDPQRRLHDIADARVEIEDVLAGEGALVSGGANIQRAADAVVPGPADSNGRRRWVFGLAAVGWLAAASLLVYGLTRTPDTYRPARISNLTYSSRDWTPTTSPDGQVVAFSSDRDGISRIWLKQMAGGGEIALTGGPDDLPRFSPDGGQILFVRDEQGARNLYRIPVVGGQPRKLMNDVLEADWSPDGQEVAFLRMTPVERGNRISVGVADVQTGIERILTERHNRFCYGIRWSPAGQQLSMCESSLTGNISEASNLDLIDIETGEIERLALTDWRGPHTAVAWAPSGQSLVVGQATDVLSHVLNRPGLIMEYDLASRTSRPLFWAPFRLPRGGWGFSVVSVLPDQRIVLDALTTKAELHEIPLGEGGQVASANPIGQHRVLTSGLGQDRQPSFSPDSRQVVFSSNRSGNIDLWIVDRQGGKLRQLTDDGANDWDPAFTPDGNNVIWSSDRSGVMEIWMAAADGSRARQVTNDGVDAENPTSTPDGQWIVYASSNDAKMGVWKIRPDGSDATRILQGSVLLPELSPDGRYALFDQFRSMDYVIQVIEVETGELMDFEIDSTSDMRHQDVTLGRARWSPDGRSICFIGQDEDGRTGVFAQDFVPGLDTRDTRRPLVGFRSEFATESLGLAPDGRSIVISALYHQRRLTLAEEVGLKYWR